jgi:hypothetical protein
MFDELLPAEFTPPNPVIKAKGFVFIYFDCI